MDARRITVSCSRTLAMILISTIYLLSSGCGMLRCWSTQVFHLITLIARSLARDMYIHIVMCCVTAAAAPAPRPPIGPQCRHPPPSLHTTTRRSSLNQSCEFIYLDNWLFLFLDPIGSLDFTLLTVGCNNQFVNLYLFWCFEVYLRYYDDVMFFESLSWSHWCLAA